MYSRRRLVRSSAERLDPGQAGFVIMDSRAEMAKTGCDSCTAVGGRRMVHVAPSVLSAFLRAKEELFYGQTMAISLPDHIPFSARHGKRKVYMTLVTLSSSTAAADAVLD
ncbi:hypothetical protein IAU59_007600 [Kwoniella sp. CBS 9459]